MLDFIRKSASFSLYKTNLKTFVKDLLQLSAFVEDSSLFRHAINDRLIVIIIIIIIIIIYPLVSISVDYNNSNLIRMSIISVRDSKRPV